MKTPLFTKSTDANQGARKNYDHGETNKSPSPSSIHLTNQGHSYMSYPELSTTIFSLSPISWHIIRIKTISILSISLNDRISLLIMILLSIYHLPFLFLCSIPKPAMYLDRPSHVFFVRLPFVFPRLILIPHIPLTNPKIAHPIPCHPSTTKDMQDYEPPPILKPFQTEVSAISRSEKGEEKLILCFREEFLVKWWRNDT